MSDFDLSGKVAVISGGSRGIGRAIAHDFAEAGANVVISSRKSENILPAAEELNDEFPGQILGVVAHTGKQFDNQQLFKLAIAEFGRIDVAVSNAATNPHFGPLLSAEESQWDKILEVNVKGTFWFCRMAATHMAKQGQGGKIIIISSIAGLKPSAMMGLYSVSKAAVIMLSKSLALELSEDNIQVNAIAPGFFRTRFSKILWETEALRDSIIKHTPAGRIGETQEITGIALYLASSASDFTTGSVFTIDGGFTLA